MSRARAATLAFLSERGHELHMLASLCLVITSFWILKPLRKALFLQHYDHAGLALGSLQLSAARAELAAKLGQALLAGVLAVAFTRLSRRYRRRALVAIVATAFACGFALLAMASAGARAPASGLVWTLYSVGDLYGTLMVAALFACVNDLATPASAKQGYGLLGLGAVIGGVLGSQVVSLFLHALPLAAWLGISCTLTLIAAALALRAPDATIAPAPDVFRPEARRTPHTSNTAPYVLALALLVGLYEILSTLLDYQVTATITQQLDGAAIGRQMSRAFALMNVTALVVQLFVTTPLLRRFGPQAALLCLPCTLLCASLGMVVLPVVAMASLVPALDSGFAYSVHQSAKEGLYVPLASDAKYGAKALVDVVVLRGAKALGLVLGLLAAALASDGAGLRMLSLVTLALVVPFGACALYAGRRCETLGRGEPATASAAVRRPVVS
jgi:AAA family ATP:ADP antiporter